jgi:Protein of unknown function (DUF3800)
MDYNFYFDESGYKGYLQEEPNHNDFCLIAGLLISKTDESSILAKLTDLFSSIEINKGEKLHATDIFKDGKNSDIKKKFLDFIKGESKIHIFHSAVYCIGVYNDRVFTQNILDRNKIDKPSNPIKTSLNKKKENVYHIPFTNIIIKLDEFCDNDCSKLNLITDRIDESIEKESKKVINEINENESRTIYKGFDTRNQTVVSKTLTINIKGFEMGVNHIKELTIDHQNSNLTIAADIIVNLIYRHLKSKIENGFDKGLNGNDIFENFELKEKIVFLDDNSLTDKLYKRQL